MNIISAGLRYRKGLELPPVDTQTTLFYNTEEKETREVINGLSSLRLTRD